MTTKPPASVKESAPDLPEKIAYAAVQTIATHEPNDRNRLGYHVWRWLMSREGTLEHAVTESGARMLIGNAEAATIIRAELLKAGIAA